MSYFSLDNSTELILLNVISISMVICNKGHFNKVSSSKESTCPIGQFSQMINIADNQDVDCNSIDHTYVRTSSPGLDSLMRREVLAFAEDLKKSQGHRYIILGARAQAPALEKEKKSTKILPVNNKKECKIILNIQVLKEIRFGDVFEHYIFD